MNQEERRLSASALFWAAGEKDRRILELEDQLVDAHATIAKLEVITTTDTCCAYCGVAYPEGTPRFGGGDALIEHIKVCLEHPMRRAMERIEQLEPLFDAVDDLLYDSQTNGYPDDYANTDHLASLRGVFLGLCTKAEVVEEKDVFKVAITYTCVHCGVLAGVPLPDMGVFDSGATLTCSHCGKDTVFLLVTPGEYADRRIKESESSLARAHRMLVAARAAPFPLSHEEVAQAKRAVLNAVKDYVEDL